MREVYVCVCVCVYVFVRRLEGDGSPCTRGNPGTFLLRSCLPPPFFPAAPLPRFPLSCCWLGGREGWRSDGGWTDPGKSVPLRGSRASPCASGLPAGHPLRLCPCRVPKEPHCCCCCDCAVATQCLKREGRERVRREKRWCRGLHGRRKSPSSPHTPCAASPYAPFQGMARGECVCGCARGRCGRMRK